ncbi:MAG: four helix bundle protein [Candidatus Omnitrophica bacterium]|nr:four helix bundle protein [Candidatus Omnitrophota bacterium]
MEEKKRITSFKDLEVYLNGYKAMLIVMEEIVPRLPEREKYDLTDQLSRACKAIPRLIAEGYAKRHQKSGFQKYIDDAMSESNEMVVSLSEARDIYPSFVNIKRCDELIDLYDKTGRQLYKLGESWNNFKRR